MIIRAPRKNLAMPVQLLFGDSESALLAHTVNISKTGMLVLSKEDRPLRALVRFQLAEFKGRGEVVWTRDAEPGVEFLKLMGIDFLPLEPYDRKALDELLDG